MVNAVAQRPARRGVMIGVAAAALGLLAFAADAVEAITVQAIVTALVSSGLAWGLAAFLAGWTGTGRRGAMVGATALLMAATLVYYMLILLVSRRWSGGYLADGSSADWYGLRSVAVMTTAWLLVSMVAGPVLGLLGQMTRTTRVPNAALAAGAACGLLSGQGWQQVATAPPWRLWLMGNPDGDYVRGILVVELMGVVLPFAVLAWSATRRRLWHAWPALFIAMAGTATLSALFWYVLPTAVTWLH
ncbi:hypothetical protein [Actinoplanes siamensis]|uniref:Uncharacterized protein n=1 Tax=Actinoplanes siamensis TaxID=1223317 RepID=A0A919NEA6_9ACTN|nr:hypothetical protein [Actinoplanes siamensis]GIF09301.1 hypothetical protein Asi03nite_68390 [Actinoplanes siamensis]